MGIVRGWPPQCTQSSVQNNVSQKNFSFLDFDLELIQKVLAQCSIDKYE